MFREVLQVDSVSLRQPARHYTYRGLKIFTSLALRFHDFQRGYYLKALAVEPDYKRTLYNLALLQANLRNYDLAYSGFCKVSNNAEANNNVGYIAMLKGDYPIAKKYLQTAIQASPEFYKKANDNLIRLEQYVENIR